MLCNKRLPCAVCELLQSCAVPARLHSNPYRTISRQSEASRTARGPGKVATRRPHQSKPILRVGTGRTQFPTRERCPVGGQKRSRTILDQRWTIVLSVVALRLRPDDFTYPPCGLDEWRVREPDFSIGALHDFVDFSCLVRILDQISIDQMAQPGSRSDP